MATTPTGPEPPPGSPTLRGDPGLQPERTALAWQRTALSFLAASLLFLRWGTQHGPIVGIVVAVSTAAATWTFFHTRTRLRLIGRLFPAPGLEPATTEVVVITGLVLVLAGAALWVTLAT